MPTAARVVSGLIWPGLPLLYLFLPGHPFGLLPGLPLGSFSLALALGLGALAWCGCRPSQRLARWLAWCFLIAAVLKLLAWAHALPHGLVGRYTAGDFAQAPERSTEWRLENATRVDRQLDFVGDQFPVHFFNGLRFNFYTSNQPRRDVLPFSARWQGWLVQENDGQQCLLLQAVSTATLRLAALPPLAIEKTGHLETREVCGEFAKGMSPIEVTYLRNDGLVPFLRVLEREPDGGLKPVPPERFLRAEALPEAVDRDRRLARFARLLDATMIGLGLAVVLGCLGRTAGIVFPLHSAMRSPRALGSADPSRARWERPLLALSLVAAFAEALAATRHFAGRTPLLSGGNDWLAYEAYARDVLLSGLLMTGGHPLGQGETFYYQPLYIYFLAALHLLLGESVYGLLLAQYFLVAVAGVLTYFLAKELFGQRAALATFTLFWVYRYLVFDQVAGLVLSENLVAIIIPPMLLLLVRWQRTFRWTHLVGSGVLLGAAILTRSTPLLFLPPALLMVALTQLRKFASWRPALGAAGIFLVTTLSVSGLVGVRNLIVAGRPALLPESASANLWEAHRPTRAVNLARVDRNPVYNRLGLDRQTREVLEFVRQDPAGYAATLAPMALYAIGVTGPALGTGQIQYELVALTGLYVAGLLFVPAVRGRPVWFLHAFVLTHFVQMMVFLSHQYGFRLPLPMYGPMAVVAGRTVVAILAAFSGIGARLHRHGGFNKGAWDWAAAGAAVMLASLWTVRELTRPRDVEAHVFGLSGDAAPAARAVSATPHSWLADNLYFSGRDERSLNVAYLPGLAFREMKWFDSSQAFIWPPESERGMHVLPRARAAPDNLECWSSRADAQVPTLAPVADTVIRWIPYPAELACDPFPRRIASFGGLVDLVQAASGWTDPSGRPAVRLAWRVVRRPAFRTQPVLESLDSNGEAIASRLADPYPSHSWEAGELVIVYIPVPRVSSTIGSGRLAVGFTRGRPSDRLPIDDPLPLYNQTRLMVER